MEYNARRRGKKSDGVRERWRRGTGSERRVARTFCFDCAIFRSKCHRHCDAFSLLLPTETWYTGIILRIYLAYGLELLEGVCRASCRICSEKLKDLFA